MTELRILSAYLESMEQQRADMAEAVEYRTEEYLDLLCGLEFAIAKLKDYVEKNTAPVVKKEDKDPLSNREWYRDEKINGDPRDILKYIFQCDLLDAGAETLVKALLLARIPTPPDSRSALKGLAQDDLLSIAEYYYPEVTLDMIRQIKKTFVSTKDKLENLKYPTSAFYREEYLDKLESACEPYVKEESPINRAYAILGIKK